MQRKLVPWIIGLGTAAASLIGTARADQPPITIGAALAGTGWLATYDGPPYRAMQIAVDEVNKNGGVLGGRKLEIYFCDTKTDREQAAKCGQEIVDKGIKFAVWSCDYDEGGPTALQYARAGIIGVSDCGSDPKLQSIGPSIFTMSTGSNAQGYLLAEWGFNRKGWRNAYLWLDPFIQYDKSLCQGFKERWTEMGGKIVGDDIIHQDDPSIAAQITKLKSANPAPDVLMLCTVNPGGASALRQLRAAGVGLDALSSEGLTGEYWLATVPGLKGFYLGTHGNIYDREKMPPEQIKMIDAYTAKFGKPPEVDHVYLGYSIVQAFVKALETAGSDDPPKLIKALESFQDVPLLAGSTSFTHDTHLQVGGRPFAFFEVDGDGHLHFIETYKAQKLWDIKAKHTQ